MPTPTPRPVATATVFPTTAPQPSGSTMPVGDLPGWRQIYAEDFNVNATVGQFLNVYGPRQMSAYPDGWPQTFGAGNPARYDTTHTTSVSGGILNARLYGDGTYWYSPALLPLNGVNQMYGRYAVRFRSDSLVTFKTAWLLWPQSEVWPRDGEIDFPEGGLDGGICAFLHRQDATAGSDQDAFCTSTGYSAWHTAVLEWDPTATRFILDGVVIGTSTSRIPNTPMHWVLQTEGCWGSPPNPCPPTGASATLQIDWITMYARV